jgi:hypothetical protein
MATLSIKRIVQGLDGHPLLEIVDGITDDLLQQYKGICDKDLEIVALVRDAINAGIKLAKTEVGDLF